jgi:hypothetical protein
VDTSHRKPADVCEQVIQAFEKWKNTD